jgi:hypothetical protein
MASDFERNLFEQELAKVRGLPEAQRWKLERDNTVALGVTVELWPAGAPDDKYLARLVWADYFGPPSLKFLNLVSRAENDPTAWPMCRGFRPGSLDACVNWTAEGHRLHPDWQANERTAFKQREAPVQFALLTLQHEMDSGYTGRGQR